jgi:TfoX/Sxy family transcriptional regulator of competence genes
MASNQGFVKHVCDRVRDRVGTVSYRPMFGEYAVYVGTKVVALVCDDQLFLKATDNGRALLGTPVEASPYPGARPYFLLDDQVDDGATLSELFLATAAALPPSRPKKRKEPSPESGDPQ